MNRGVYSSAIHLRRAVPADVPAIAAIEEASFSHPGERFGLRRVRHLTISPRPMVIVAEMLAEASHKAVVGWIAAFNWNRGKIPWGRIYAIAVDPAARGQKLGQRLMHAMMSELESRGASQIFLEVRPDNHAALRLYDKLGFAECRRLPHFYGRGIDGVRMVRITASSPAASL
jgi:ribosomal protein S18 acetylase RimI-like enzyme